MGPSNEEDDSEMDILGRPYSRVKRVKFMDDLNHSLKLSNDLSPKESYWQYRALNFVKRHLNKGRKYNFGDGDNLMLNQFLDLNYVQMGEFSHLDERSKSKFLYKLLKLADYTTETRDFLLDMGGYTDVSSTWKGGDFDGEDSKFYQET